MDNEAMQEESLGGSSTVESNDAYHSSSEDSRFSWTSEESDEFPTEVNSYEWLDDSSYEPTQYYDASNAELGDSALDEPVHVFSRPQAEEHAEAEENIGVETLEENNNDPNNNMDSNEVTNVDEESILMEQSSESGILMDRTSSPQPGCSKDSLPVTAARQSPLTEREIHEQTQHILRLVASIDAHSVSKAIRKKPRTRINDVKLWDLLPKRQRSIYPEISDVCGKAAGSTAKSVAEVEDNGSQAGSSGDQNSASAVSSVKRGPNEDICTVGCKKPPSNPDVMILATKLAPTAKSHSSIGIIPRETIGNRDKSLLRANVFAAQAPPPPQPIPVAQPYVIPQNRPGAADKVSVVNAFQGARPKQRPQIPPQKHRSNKVHMPAFDGPRHVSSAPHSKHFVINPAAPPGGPSFVPPRSGHAHPQAKGAVGHQPTAMPVDPTPAQNAAPHQQSTKRPVCMEMYYKLRNIFPNVDPKYLKKLCPPEWGPGDRDAQVTPIVEFLLSKGDALPPAPVKPPKDEAAGAAIAYGNVDDVYENLLGIFPDADPHYLRDFAEKNFAQPDAIKEFVELKLESRDYPTKEQYRARLKITEQQRQYTTGFNIQQYLAIIPDPLSHFMDPKRKCEHSTVAFEFLKSHFGKNKVTTILRIYKQNAFNLSASSEALELVGPEMKTKRGGYEMPTEDILLLQEIAFVKHKAEISEYIENKKKAEEAEFKMLKENNFLVECQCCYDSECIPSKCSSCDQGHLFCNRCIISGTNTTLGDGGTRISCFLNCGSEIGLSVLQQVLAPITFSILLKKRQAAEVIEAGLEGLVSCPFCNFASIPPEEDKIFKCLNPECTKESCRLCKELSHVPLKCNEVMKAEKARLYIEESMTAALARKCYRCQRAFFKEEGCNKIQCPCGALMCYLCDQPIKDYKHFRGQGSNEPNLCPLYSDTIRLDAVAVRRIAEEAQKKVMQQNPNIKIDTSKLLPEIPNATAGPHTTILNADELPLRAQRVLDLNPL